MTGERSRAGKRTFLDLTIWSAGLVYIALVLFVNLDSPLFGLLLIVLAGYELLEPRRRRQCPPEGHFGFILGASACIRNPSKSTQAGGHV